MSNAILYSIPILLALVLLELAWSRRHPAVKGYELRDTVTSLSLGVFDLGVTLAMMVVLVPAFTWLYDHRLVDVVGLAGAWSWLVLLFAEDCCYYWFHRSHHEVRFLWAAHVNHHSSRHYNLSTALRQPVLTPLTGPVFWAPLPLIGFPPWMIVVAQTVSLLYQFGLHTEVIGRLGPLEHVFNTPSHHRVHHGKNVRYLDKNHGGIFIIWDRLFGTFVREDEPVVYGLTKDLETWNPLRIAFHEIAALARDVRRAPSLRAGLAYLFAPPGWSHDGSTSTATQLQQQRWARPHAPKEHA